MENHTEQDHPVLIGQTGPLDGKRWMIDKNLVIGRDVNCDIIIITPDKQVSRRHAEIVMRDGDLLLSDLGSKNGTHLNSERISANPVKLQDGDTIQIALAQQFVFLSSDATVPLDTDGLESTAMEQKKLLCRVA